VAQVEAVVAVEAELALEMVAQEEAGVMVEAAAAPMQL
jgi:hypothetical protein